MVPIIPYGIVSSLKPDIYLHLNLSLTVSTINHCLINILIEKEKRLYVHSSIAYQRKQQPKFLLMGGNYLLITVCTFEEVLHTH